MLPVKMVGVVVLMMHLELTLALAVRPPSGSQPSRGLFKGGGNQRPVVRLVEQPPTSTIAAYFEAGADFRITRRRTLDLPDGLHYCDNTEFIRELEDCGSSRCLFTRPPRFGKTFLMSMLMCYYDEQVQGDDYQELFKGLAIHKNETAGRGKFQVLKLSLINEETPAGLASVINRQALDFAEKYRYSYAGTAPEVRKTWAEVEEVRLSYELKNPSFFNFFNVRKKLRLKKALRKLAAEKAEAECFTFDEEDGLKTLQSLAKAVRRSGEKRKQKGEPGAQLYLFLDEYDNFVYQRLTPEKKGSPKEDAAEIKNDRNSVALLLNELKNMENDLVVRYLVLGLSRNRIGRQSRANSIKCISNVPALADVCGFTRDDANRSLACIEPQLTPSEQEQALALMTDCFNGYHFPGSSSSGVFNSQLCMSFLNKLCLQEGEGEGRKFSNRCWLDPDSSEFWVTMKDNDEMFKTFVSTVGDDQCIPNGDILNMLVASDVGFEQLKRLIRSAVKQDKEARAARDQPRGLTRVVDEIRGDFDPIPFSKSELGERYDVSSLLTGPTRSVVNNYMYDMGIGTLAKDGLSLQVPNKFVLSLLLNQLEPLSDSTKRSRLIQNAEDAGRRSKEVLDFLQELTDVFPGL
mmetsp:Transcript_34484/g.82148  ORF Transcript_34484/g.82148 Transcript_34484/m.82148 type:complete len:632 (+) Transcript_34484:177-2072(+)